LRPLVSTKRLGKCLSRALLAFKTGSKTTCVCTQASNVQTKGGKTVHNLDAE
jgi:hypothetical protein